MQRRRQQTAMREGDKPTPEQFRHGDWERHYDTRLAHADGGNTVGYRRVPPYVRWQRNGWIDGEQFRAVARLADERDTVEAAYVHVRSCCDMTPVGHVQRGGLPEHAAIAVVQWQRHLVELGRLLGDDFDDALKLLAGVEYASVWPRYAEAQRQRNAAAVVRRLAVAAVEVVG